VTEAAEATKSTCYWCGTTEGEGEAELFIVHDDISGVCDRCVGYLMGVLAIDLRSTFEHYVETARTYSDNNEAVRKMKEAAKRLV